MKHSPSFATLPSRSMLRCRFAVAAPTEAEALAAAVPLAEGAYFTAHRKAIRDALEGAGLAARLDRLVTELVPPE